MSPVSKLSRDSQNRMWRMVGRAVAVFISSPPSLPISFHEWLLWYTKGERKRFIFMYPDLKRKNPTAIRLGFFYSYLYEVLLVYVGSSSDTIFCTRFPSALPFTFGMIAPITLPISFFEEAFVAAIASRTISRTSCSLS